MTKTRIDPIFVHCPDGDIRGPFDADEAIAVIGGEVAAAPEALATLRRGHAEGRFGPWTFTDGPLRVTAWAVTGYLGSDAELLDIAQGIEVGGRCMWRVHPDDMDAEITAIAVDEDGDAWFDLAFEDHKDVCVLRSEIAPLPRRGA